MTSIPSNTTSAKGTAAKKRKSKKLSVENVLNITGGSEIAATILGDKVTDSANGSQTGREKTEKEYIKEVSKRLKRQAKKMENIKRSEDKIKELTEEEQATTILINADERSKIATKPITSAVYKELCEIHDALKKVADAEDKRVDEEKAETDIKFNNTIAEAREEGRKAGAEEATAKIFTVVRFLRLAGYRRQYKSEDDREDEAIEKLLVLVYGGDQTAIDTCLKLANGAEEKIDGFDVTYGQIKEVAHALKLAGEEELPEESEEPETEAAVELEITENDVDIELTAPEGDADEPPTHTALVETAGDSATHAQDPANSEIEALATVLAVTFTTDEVTNEEGGVTEPAEAKTIEPVEATTEAPTINEAPAEKTIPTPTSPAVVTGTESESWADDEEKDPEAAIPAIPENKEGEFQNVERRGGRGWRGGDYRGGGGYRGYHDRGGNRGLGYRPRGGSNFPRRGDGEYRGRSDGGYRGRGDGEYRGRGDGEYRGRGDGEYRGRGDGEYRGRGDGEYRGRGDGEYRGRGDGEYRGRGDGEYRGRGDGEYRGRGDGEYRGRGGYRGGNRGRGRGEHHGPRPQQPPQQEPPAQQPAAVSI